LAFVLGALSLPLDVRKGIDKDEAYGSSSFVARAQFKPTQSIAVTGTFFGDVANGRVNDNPLLCPVLLAVNDFHPLSLALLFSRTLTIPIRGEGIDCWSGLAALLKSSTNVSRIVRLTNEWQPIVETTTVRS